jgi:ATP-binding protein involved in chromosome partitioning
MESREQRWLQAVNALRAPGGEAPIATLGAVRGLQVGQNDEAELVFVLDDPSYAKRSELAELLAQALQSAGASKVTVTFQAEPRERQVADDDPVPGAKNVVLVMSGKGGVGKSTVATNLAMALSRMGTRVGLLDADMYGPSLPTMLGISGRPMSDGQKIQPLQRFGVKLMSIGFLMEDPKAAIVWRGPMLHGALLQFLRDVAWGELDYLVLDLPPGTGDIALTLSQQLRASGAVIVTTPQEVALQDVYKSVAMAKKLGIPIVGVIENESYFVCDGCSKRHEIFGAGGGQKVAELAGAPLIGQIPLDTKVREWGDAGTPVVQASPGSEVARAFVAAAERLVQELLSSVGDSSPLTIDRSGGSNRHLPIAR